MLYVPSTAFSIPCLWALIGIAPMHSRTTPFLPVTSSHSWVSVSLSQTSFCMALPVSLSNTSADTSLRHLHVVFFPLSLNLPRLVLCWTWPKHGVSFSVFEYPSVLAPSQSFKNANLNMLFSCLKSTNDFLAFRLLSNIHNAAISHPVCFSGIISVLFLWV